MAFATINYHSRSLDKASSFNIVFPDDAATPRPWLVFYLLHGLSDDDTIWMRRTSIERYVAGFPLVVVIPDGGRGWYTNALQGLSNRIASSTAISNRCMYRTSIRSLPANTTGPTGTSISKKPSRFMHVT